MSKRKFSLDEVLHFCVAETIIPSTFGAQLDRLRFGIQGTADPVRAREDAEYNMLEQAELIRFVDSFEATQVFYANTSRGEGYKTLEKIAKYSPRSQGQLALGIIKAYQKWACGSQERGFLAVYSYIKHTAPRLSPPIESDIDKALQSFRDGSAKAARELATNAYADAILALSAHVRKNNKR